LINLTEHFFDFIEEKKRNFEKILPELKEKQSSEKEKNEAEVYAGIKGIKEVYNKILNSQGKEYNSFGGGKRVTYEVMGETWWENLHTKRISKGIKSRQVFDESIRKFGETLNKRKLTKIKFLSQDFEQLTETVIFGEYVAIVIFTENPYALLIKDKIVADSYRKNFELLWKKARD